MIVKIIGNRGGGSAKASVDYLLGKDRDRENARILEGDPDITQKLADSLDFKNKYTVGVLSFEEDNLPEKKKYEIIEKFEKATFAGLDKNQYSISWIEHTDKGRLELNFIVANVELESKKRLQPYYDKVDRKHINNFQNVINHEYKLSDPHDPTKKQLSNALSVKNLPKKTAYIKTQIDKHITELIESDLVKNRDDVINILKSSGFEISRTTDNSISLKNPDPDGRNIRLKGAIYENREFSGKLTEEHANACTDYRTGREENYKKSLQELERSTDRKREYNQKTYSKDVVDPNISSYSNSNNVRDNGHINNRNISEIQRNTRAENSRDERGALHQSKNEHEQSEIVEKNTVPTVRWETVYSRQRGTGSLHIEDGRHTGTSEVNSLTFEYSPTQKTLTVPPKSEPIKTEIAKPIGADINQILAIHRQIREKKERELKAKQDNKKQSSKVNEVYNYAKQFYSKCREFIERVRQRKPQISGIQQDIDNTANESKQREPIIANYHRDIKSTNQRIGDQSRNINTTEQAFNGRKSIIDNSITDVQNTIRDIEITVRHVKKPTQTLKKSRSDDRGLSKDRTESFTMSR